LIFNSFSHLLDSRGCTDSSLWAWCKPVWHRRSICSRKVRSGVKELSYIWKAENIKDSCFSGNSGNTKVQPFNSCAPRALWEL
jgi:hypothetical protein